MKFIVCCFALMMAAGTVSAQKANDVLLLDMYQNQRFADAAEYLKGAYPEPITDMKVLSRFAYTYQMAGKLPDALSYYQRMYAQDSTNMAVLFNLANINLKREDNGRALNYFQRIIAIDSTNFMVYKQLGRLYADKMDTINATKHLQKANTINPEDADVASELSLIMVKKGKDADAEKILRRALVADSTNLFLLRTLMKLNYTMSKYPATIKTCKVLLQLGDKAPAIYDKMGSSYYNLKNYECAIGAFMEIPSIFQTERILYLTAVSYKKLKDHNKAIEYYDQTLKASISDNVWDYYNEMADSYHALRQLKRSTVNYQKSLFFSEEGMVIYTLANLYDTDLHDKKNALKYYNMYLNSRPPAKQKAYVDYVMSRVKVLGGK